RRSALRSEPAGGRRRGSAAAGWRGEPVRPAPPAAPHSFSGSGVLNLDQPSRPTSHDVGARVRRPFRTRRVGHAGTLDRAATGVLVVLLGGATRLAEYVTDLPKRYEAEVLFGRRTDSQDSTGTLLSECDTSSLTEAAVLAAMEPLRGDILQVPPMVSAVKV